MSTGLDQNQRYEYKEHDFNISMFWSPYLFFRPSYFHLRGRLAGCLYCPESNVSHLSAYFSYRHAFHTAFGAINEAGLRGVAYLRTYTPSHFEGVTAWDKGGDCVRRRPYRRSEVALEDYGLQLYLIQLEELRVAQEEGRRRSGGTFKLFDATVAMLLRPDGHPSRYGHWPWKLQMELFPIRKARNLIRRRKMIWIIAAAAAAIILIGAMCVNNPQYASPPPKIPSTAPLNNNPPSQDIKIVDGHEECDVPIGDWVPNPEAPNYTNKTCWAIHDHQNCMKYGRPDSDFIKWRWKPNGCDLPLFNPCQFLDIVRGKSLAFVGDSVGRNQMQSIICLLSRFKFYKRVNGVSLP
ncbi:hypothetical protein SASPL_123088 [Salvia splendens]|uniref:Trichome birefringence-like N-terminal domain-containing protein n=1 Tax=Salvia splendens TaxID=180675 RepID=A0A8X8XNC9_SALSN|nr:hypothetical protein SASPL_123088 [Salvia splendens]